MSLAYDICRCDGKGCPYRDSCKRYTQRAIDAKDPNATDAPVDSFYRRDATCTHYIQEPFK